MKSLIFALIAFGSLKLSAEPSVVGSCSKVLAHKTTVNEIIQITKLENKFDTVVLTLTINNNQVKYRSLYKKLKKEGANLLSGKYLIYESKEQPILSSLGYATTGQGYMRIRATKSELLQFKFFIEHADDIKVYRGQGSDESGLIKARRSIEEKMHPHSLPNWEKFERSKSATSISIQSYNDKKHFNRLMSMVRMSGFEIIDPMYNDAQSTGYFTISGPPDHLKSVIELYSDIHVVFMPYHYSIKEYSDF